MLRNLWRQYAFLARYGHQRVPDLQRMTVRQLNWMQADLEVMLKREPSLSFGGGGGG